MLDASSYFDIDDMQYTTNRKAWNLKLKKTVNYHTSKFPQQKLAQTYNRLPKYIGLFSQVKLRSTADYKI